MFGIKTFVQKKANLSFEKILKKNSFPNKAPSFIQKKVISWSIVKKLRDESSYKQVQIPVSKFTHPLSRNILKKILPFNPNNLGNWLETKPFHLSGLLEKKIVLYVIDLLSANKSKLNGYLTSGGTEANLFIMWMGRNLLKKNLKIDEMILVQTGLTHYSITKAANITNIDTIETSLSSKDWGMSSIFLDKTIRKEYEKGKRGFLLPLTLGYTITGSDDPINEIDKLITKLKKELPNSSFFCWIDAAFSGIIKPFTEDNFSPFSFKNVSAFLTDFHKFPSFPYSSGIVIYKKDLIKNIDRKISYIGMNDSTLLGSRPGISAISTWYCLKMIGKSGFRKMIKESLEEKQEFIKEIKNKIPSVKIITQKMSVQAGIYAKDAKQKTLLPRLGLYPTQENIILDGKKEKITIYKIYFLPFYNNEN